MLKGKMKVPVIFVGIICVLSIILSFTMLSEIGANAVSYKGLVVIDPGHGGTDPGAIHGDVEEKLINAQLSYKVAKDLQARGYEVWFTHEIGYATGVPQDIPVLMPKTSGKYDLYEIAAAIDKKSPDIAISIHHNAATSTSANGFEAYYRTDQTPTNTHSRSIYLAQSVTGAMKNLTYINPRYYTVQDGKFIVTNVDCPSILLEAGFMSNTAELANLVDEAKQLLMAKEIANGIDTYFAKFPTNVVLPSADSVKTSNVNEDAGTFKINVNGVTTDSSAKVEKVRVAVWAKKDQSDLIWYDAISSGNGNWYVNVNLADYDFAAGTYQVHTYVTDSRNIVQYVGATSQKMSTNNLIAASATLNSAHTQASVLISKAEDYATLDVAVWSDTGGQDDLIWYKVSGGASRTLTVNMSSHKNSTGTYQVHVYSNGKYVTATSFKVETPTAGAIQISNLNSAGGTFRATVTGVSAPAGVKEVKIAAWTKSDKSDLHWYKATNAGNGNWYVDVNAANHNSNSGTYVMHCYVYDSSGKGVYVGAASQQIQLTGKLTATATVNSAHTQVAINLTQAQSYGTIDVAVWSSTGGQDDLVWYKVSGGASRTLTVKMSSHKNSLGAYQVHVYSGGKYVTATNFTVTGPTAGAIQISNVNSSVGTFRATVTGVSAPAGVKEVKIAAWTKSDQSDLYWYKATNAGNGNWYVDVNAAKHNSNSGTYVMHCYVYDNNGKSLYTGAASQQIQLSNKLTATASVNSAQTQSTISLTNASTYGTLDVAVWSDTGGQDDLVWYRVSGGAGRTLTVNMSTHKNSIGTYQVHVYSAGKYLTATNFKISGPTASDIQISNVNSAGGTFRVTVTGVSAPAGVKEVRIAAWTKSDQSDLHWYKATNAGNGNWYVDVNAANHNSNSGTYVMHCYVYDSSGKSVYVGAANQHIQLTNKLTATASVNSSQTQATVNIANAGAYGTFDVAVWSDIGGHDDLKWYKASGGASRAFTIDMSAHKNTTGLYYVDVYSSGKHVVSTTFNVDEVDIPTNDTAKITATILEEVVGSFTVNVSSVTSNAKSVSIVVWSAADKSDAKTYSATNSGEGNWTAKLNSLLVNTSASKFNIEAIITEANDSKVKVNAISLSIKGNAYTIMGAPAANEATTIARMVNYYNSSGHTYPSFYASKGATTINDFAKIVYDEAVTEGVRPEVLFAQIVKETGYMQFGGDVNIEQCNFGGLGATGGGVTGEVFPDVRTGIRAQVQHLVAYAVPGVTEADLKNPCVDNRFKWVSKGVAPYVVWLGNKENPAGTGWAAGDDYGIQLLSIINEILSK